MRRQKERAMRTLPKRRHEAAKSQVWPPFAVKCKYPDRERARQRSSDYDEALSMLVHRIHHPNPWVFQ